MGEMGGWEGLRLGEACSGTTVPVALTTEPEMQNGWWGPRSSAGRIQVGWVTRARRIEAVGYGMRVL